MSGEEMDLITKRQNMGKESWIKNVMRIYPEKTREETEKLYDSLLESEPYKPVISNGIVMDEHPGLKD